MTLSEELAWRGFVNQTTYKSPTALDGDPITFYWGVDPSSDSMTIGNLAMAMMVRHFMAAGHKAILLVGGATGMIGDPDGKKQERDLLTLEQIAANKAGITAQYQRVFAGLDFAVVDNYDWFKSMNYLTFLRDVGKHVPMRQMLGREFVQTRLSEDGAGISYAEFSYSLIQGYDFLHLHHEKGASLQVAGADQWGNSIAGVELIRRVTGNEANVWTGPIVVNKTTGVKFGKSEAGAVWLDPAKTSPYDFYQFWLNVDDAGVEDYLKIYTMLDRPEIERIMHEFTANPADRAAQKALAREVTALVHGESVTAEVMHATEVLFGGQPLDDAVFAAVKHVFPSTPVAPGTPFLEALVSLGLAGSNTEARRFVQDGAITVNGAKAAADKQSLEAQDFRDSVAIIKRGKNSVAVARQ